MGLKTPITGSENRLDEICDERLQALINDSKVRNNLVVNGLFVWLMVIQYVVGIVLAIWLTPQTWVAETPYLHLHVWFAVIFGGILSGLPIYFARFLPEATATRYVMAISQAFWSALLIHLSGGRLETHFHVFASLAFIAFYRDWKVLATMTVVVAADHAIRGSWWPLSVYGVVSESPWRWIEHTVWVLMEDVVLVFSCLRGKREEFEMCQRQAELETLNTQFEDKVAARTFEIEKAKRKAERLALVVKHTDNSVLILDAEGRTEWVNDAFTANTGYLLEDILGKTPYEVLAGPDTEPAAVAQLIEGLTSGTGFDIEITKHCKDGRPLVMEIEARPIFNDKNEVVQFVQIERDITQRKRHEAERQRLSRELQESAAHLSKLALVAQRTSNAVIITDADGKAEWVNEGFTRTTGYELEDILGRAPGHILQGPETSAKTVKEISSCVSNQRAFSGEIINYTKDGEPYWSHLQINPARDESGKVDRFIGVVTDISERKEAEKERDLLNKKLNSAARIAGRAEVATGVLHNVGNVLNSVNVSATLIKEKAEQSSVALLRKGVDLLGEEEETLVQFLTVDKRGKNFPKFIRNVTGQIEGERDSGLSEIESLLKNIEHIREIVSAQQSSATRQKIIETFQVEELIDSAINVVQSSLIRHDIKIVKQIRGPIAITSEQHELIQILINLIKNAKEACEDSEKRRVTVSAVEASEFVKIQVTDTGVGIAPNHLSHMFQNGFTTKSNGHGFGLHAAAITATELGGSLEVFSNGAGKGATFTLRVPVVRPIALAESKCEATEATA